LSDILACAFPLSRFVHYLHREADHLHPPLFRLERLHPFLRRDVVQVTARDAQVGVPELLLDVGREQKNKEAPTTPEEGI